MKINLSFISPLGSRERKAFETENHFYAGGSDFSFETINLKSSRLREALCPVHTHKPPARGYSV